MEAARIMITAIESYSTLRYSPFVLAPLFEAFYEKTAAQPKNILLAYLVLPLVLSSTSRSFLKKANKKSSLRTFCNKPERLHGLPERIRDYRSLTNVCVQFGIDSGRMRIENDLSITVLARTIDASACPKDALKAAEKLGNVFQLLDVPAIYRYLGVRGL
jgi:hypothetical protein